MPTIANVGEVLGGLAQDAKAAINISRGSNNWLGAIDAAVSAIGSALSAAQYNAIKVGGAMMAYKLGLIGIVANKA
jgi:hypothetical protein